MRRVDQIVTAAFGIAPADRQATVAAMLATGRKPAGGYWLEVVVAMVLATLGLVIGSTAVVIGAMLVSPLMTPIVQLGMGLAIGSPLLVVRSSLRVASSCILVVSGAALVVLVLPFQETTSEISARVSPTALDLAIASACAIAGLFAVIRPGSETTTTAAGTAIGIALVPPLCVVGFGIGTGTERIAAGAGLLFTANFCAIILFSVIGFLVFGYGKVPVAELERSHAGAFSPTRLSGRIAHRLSLFFASRASRVVRIAMPLALVLVVLLPLRTALGEVAWEVRVRSAVRAALADLPGETVQSAVHVGDHAIAIRVVIIGDAERAARVRAALRERIVRAAPEVEPTIEVATVADARALARAQAALADRSASTIPPSISRADLPAVRADVTHALESWPADTTGEILEWKLAFAKSDGVAIVTVIHLGTPIGRAAAESLEKMLGSSLGGIVRVADVALPTQAIERDAVHGDDWLVAVVRELERADALGVDAKALSACVAVVAEPDRELAQRMRGSIETNPRVTVQRRDARTWSFRWSTSGCARADAGAATDASDAGAEASPDGAFDPRP